jgi:hypothetical protein
MIAFLVLISARVGMHFSFVYKAFRWDARHGYQDNHIGIKRVGRSLDFALR